MLLSPEPKEDKIVAAVLIKHVFCQNLLHGVILKEEDDEQDRPRERKNDSRVGLESRDCFASRVVRGENKGRRISFAYPACHPDLSGDLRVSTAELGKYVLILQGWVYETGRGGGVGTLRGGSMWGKRVASDPIYMFALCQRCCVKRDCNP